MSFTNTIISRKFLLDIYRWAIIVCVLPIILPVAADAYQNYSGKYLSITVLLAGLTYFCAEKICIRATKFFNDAVNFAGIFTFIAMFMLGTGASVLIATVETVALLKRPKDRSFSDGLFQLTIPVIRTYLACLIVQSFFGNLTTIRESQNWSFAAALCLAAAAINFFDFLLLTPYDLLRDSFSQLKITLRFRLWSSRNFLIGAILAGTFIKLAQHNEWFAVAVFGLFSSAFYFVYQNYIKTFDALGEAEAKFRCSFDYAPIGMAIVSQTGEWLQINEQFRNLLKIESGEMPADKYKKIIFYEDFSTVEEKLKSLIEGKISAIEAEVRLVDTDGCSVWTAFAASKIKSSNADVYIIFQFQNIDSRKRAEEKLCYDAAHDSLTALPNRAAFLSELQENIDSFDASANNFFAVLFIDLDNFKIINDSLGHNAGDELLRVTAERLSGSVREIDTVARLGGDEFTILIKNLTAISEANVIAESILENFSTPLKLSAGTYLVGLSIGIAVNSGNYKTAYEMLRDADAAMYKSKSLGKNRHSVFEAEMFMQTNRALQVINDLPQSIENNEIVLHYQPIQDLQTSEVVGFEVLSRWHHPVYGKLLPLEFIPLAEEYGIIQLLDNWVMLNACRQLKEWQNTDRKFVDLTISVNVSPKQLLQNGFAEYVKWVLKTTDIAATCLNIEITESVLIHNLEKASEIINNLNAMGVKVALDDFGTGYSSLSYLRKLPISILKIDRSFVQSMESNPTDIEILQTIVALASKLQIKVTAEGVETYKQFESLRKMNCHFGQGYNFSRPVEAAKALEYLISNKSQTKDASSGSQKTLLQLIK